MGHDNEMITKNYYVNMGEKQGLESGTVLDVFRVISRLDPYETKKRYNYRVKIGELEVIHAEENSAITNIKTYEEAAKKGVFFDVPGLMIGDHIGVKVN